ncbi:MAG TPA: hypothetical protein PK587_03415 [Syntrophales bacterium]|nr:hypothetical protein [Syntrophales bacterium]
MFTGISRITAAVVFLLALQIGDTSFASGRMFDWEPFRAAGIFAAHGEWDEWKEFLSEDVSRDLQTELSSPGKSTGQARDYRRFRFSFSRYAAAPPRSPFEEQREINRWSMIQSLPDTLSNAGSNRERFEAIGKLFEPKVSLGIEF